MCRASLLQTDILPEGKHGLEKIYLIGLIYLILTICRDLFHTRPEAGRLSTGLDNQALL
jgi:hypothetical protein